MIALRAGARAMAPPLASPLSPDPTAEDFTPIPNRKPLIVTILNSPAQLAAHAVELRLVDSMVVLAGCGVATIMTTALGPRGGAKVIPAMLVSLRALAESRPAALPGVRETHTSRRVCP